MSQTELIRKVAELEIIVHELIENQELIMSQMKEYLGIVVQKK